MKNRIILLGMMGSGKSTIARELGNKTHGCVFEADSIFEKENKILIKDYFKKFGEASFRKKETQILKNILKNEKFILSTGGGVVLEKNNREMIFDKKNLSIYLSASFDTIYERIKYDKTRPLLLVENPKAEIEKILLSREEFYKQSDIIIRTDNKNIDTVVEEILKIIN